MLEKENDKAILLSTRILEYCNLHKAVAFGKWRRMNKLVFGALRKANVIDTFGQSDT